MTRGQHAELLHPVTAGVLESQPLYATNVEVSLQATTSPCKQDCQGRGVCNLETGRCACRSGYSGDACEARELYPCNTPQGNAIISRCAGSCDEGVCSLFSPSRARAERRAARTESHGFRDFTERFSLGPIPNPFLAAWSSTPSRLAPRCGALFFSGWRRALCAVALGRERHVTRERPPGALADRNKCYCGEGSAFPQRAMNRCYFDGIQDAMPWEVSLQRRPHARERESSSRLVRSQRARVQSTVEGRCIAL